MHINNLADAVRAKLPWPIWNILRKLVNGALGPLHFGFETGYVRSCLKSVPVDRRGNALPWYSYPAIEFILAQDFASKRILEWGAGQSTIFWARRAREVVAIESDPIWHKKILPQLPSNAKLHLVKEDLSDLEDHLDQSSFDLIIVDGLDRFKCAEKSVPLLAQNGAIIVDNANINFGPHPGYGIFDLYLDLGLQRVDFIGYVPCITVQDCTSVYFRNSCFLFEGGKMPRIRLTVYDLPKQTDREHP